MAYNLKRDQAAVVVTLLDTSSSNSTTCENSGPDSLHLDPNNGQQESDIPADGSGYSKERRGSKSCLKVTDECGGGVGGPSGSVSPARRRSVHFDSSPPAETFQLPVCKDEKEQRGCDALSGPSPYAPEQDNDADEETKRLALAKAIARRQSAPVNFEGGGAGARRSRMFSPPPPTLEGASGESDSEEEDGT
jgi:hypothetical protein